LARPGRSQKGQSKGVISEGRGEHNAPVARLASADSKTLQGMNGEGQKGEEGLLWGKRRKMDKEPRRGVGERATVEKKRES